MAVKNSNQQESTTGSALGDRSTSAGSGEASSALLTVVIPHLNAPDALSDCLASLAAECSNRTSDIAVIVVDNGSSLRPEAVCAVHPFVRLIDEPEPGPGPARSQGARLAKTGIVAFVDADCAVRPGWMTALLDHFRTHPETSVIGGDVRIACADSARPTAIEAYESVYGYRMKLYVERDHYTATCNMAVRRDAFLKVGDFVGIHTAEDVDWGRRATALGLGIDYVPDMVIETPARATFAELARKWDRHISHDFAEITGPMTQVRWVFRALALGASPLAEIPRIIRSDRLSKPRDRCLALACLIRIRLYRCGRMLGLLIGFGRSSETAWRNSG
ncbi:MAG: glycosyltransferase [Sulfitobacter sp.]